ncbi:hypothetical protein FRC12_011136 [Ceratobasidium sp. 428]|nr:hypothetical protein FRC12_011136 [Ceratobasidium sp. 428]
MQVAVSDVSSALHQYSRSGTWSLYASQREIFGYEISTRGNFERIGKDGYIEVSMNNPNDCVVFLADPQTFRDITRPRAPYYHDLKANKMFLELLGTNMVVLEGEEWKRHRRIAQRAFNENLPQLIWTETMLALDEAYDLWDLHHGQRVNLPQVAQMTKTLALMVIAAAALGKRLSWIEDQEQPEPGFTMSFQTAAKIVAEGVVTRALLPTWAEGATQTTRTVVTGYKEFKVRFFQVFWVKLYPWIRNISNK